MTTTNTPYRKPMTREIKFRAKRIDNNDWVYGHYFISPLTDENSGTKPEARTRL